MKTKGQLTLSGAERGNVCELRLCRSKTPVLNSVLNYSKTGEGRFPGSCRVTSRECSTLNKPLCRWCYTWFLCLLCFGPRIVRRSRCRDARQRRHRQLQLSRSCPSVVWTLCDRLSITHVTHHSWQAQIAKVVHIRPVHKAGPPRCHHSTWPGWGWSCI